MTEPDVEDPYKLIPSVYLLLRRDADVLLLRRANTGYMDGSYNLLAGYIEAGEPAKDAMVRGAKEEAGITINPDDLRLLHVGCRYNRDRIDLFFITDTWQGEITNMKPDKCDDLSWYPLAQLPDTTIPYIRFVLDVISKGANYSDYLEKI